MPIIDHQSRDLWIKSGSKSVRKRVGELGRQYAEKNRVKLIDSEVKSALDVSLTKYL